MPRSSSSEKPLFRRCCRGLIPCNDGINPIISRELIAPYCNLPLLSDPINTVAAAGAAAAAAAAAAVVVVVVVVVVVAASLLLYAERNVYT